MNEATALYLTAGLMFFGASIGAAMGISKIGASFLEGLGRQPTLLPMFRQQLFILVGLIDAIPMMAVGMALFILFAAGPAETEKSNGNHDVIEMRVSP